MNIQIFGMKKCNDTKKAERFFKERGIKYQFIDMQAKGMSKGEFNSVAQVNGGLENMINGQKDLAKAYADVNSDSFILTLSHCPDSIEEISSYPSDYFLAGHSLGGSIYIPIFNSFYRFKGAEKHFHGSDIINGTYLEITNGVGLGKSKARLFADSEIVLYKLSSAS